MLEMNGSKKNSIALSVEEERQEIIQKTVSEAFEFLYQESVFLESILKEATEYTNYISQFPEELQKLIAEIRENQKVFCEKIDKMRGIYESWEPYMYKMENALADKRMSLRKLEKNLYTKKKTESEKLYDTQSEYIIAEIGDIMEAFIQLKFLEKSKGRVLLKFLQKKSLESTETIRKRSANENKAELTHFLVSAKKLSEEMVTLKIFQ